MISTRLPLSKKITKRSWSDFLDRIKKEQEVQPGDYDVGKIYFVDGKESTLLAPPQHNEARYNLKYNPLQNILGLYIPSHKLSITYNRIINIPIDPKTSHQQYQEYMGLLQSIYNQDQVRNPGMILKQSLISLALFGYGNEAVIENPEYRKMFEDFQDILHILLPKNLGFEKMEIRLPDIVFVTKSGDFSLDTASGGIGALVGLAWEIFMYGQDKNEFVVTIDEPESHLHPSMQRELLPNLFKAFPKTQFIIATHSPFIITSSPKSKVYALIFNENQRVNSTYLESAELSGSANETLREILGVPITVPIWVENRFKEVLDKYQQQELTEEILHILKKELIDNELGLFLPEALAKLGEKNA